MSVREKLEERYKNPELLKMYDNHPPVHVVYRDDITWIWASADERLLWLQHEPGDMKTPFNCWHKPEIIPTHNIRIRDTDLPGDSIRVDVITVPDFPPTKPREKPRTEHSFTMLSIDAAIWLLKTFGKDMQSVNRSAETGILYGPSFRS